MSLVNLKYLIEGIKRKSYCKYCVYMGENANCAYPGDCGCSSMAMQSAIIQYINGFDVESLETNILVEKRFSNRFLQPNYVKILEEAVEKALNNDLEFSRKMLIEAGILNEDGTPKEHIVDNE